MIQSRGSARTHAFGVQELCVKVEVAALDSPVPKKTDGFCERKRLSLMCQPDRELNIFCQCEVAVALEGYLGPLPDKPYGFCGC